MFAIINYKGNQYLVSPEREYDIDLISEADSKDKKIEFPEVLLISDDSKVTVGQPSVAGATVTSEIISEIRDPKTTVLKFHSKKRYQRTLGHRAKKTRIKILKINVETKK